MIPHARQVAAVGSVRAPGLQGSIVEGKDLRKAGLKVTLPRLKILEILEDGGARHKSAEDIYKALLGSNEDIGLATVARVLGFEIQDHSLILHGRCRRPNCPHRRTA